MELDDDRCLGRDERRGQKGPVSIPGSPVKNLEPSSRDNGKALTGFLLLLFGFVYIYIVANDI